MQLSKHPAVIAGQELIREYKAKLATSENALLEAQRQTAELSRQLIDASERLRNDDASFWAQSTRQISRLWRSSAVPPSCGGRGIDDPIHGRIFLDSTLARVLSHPLVQRLAHVKQLSFAYAEFPSATHSRLSHSLGAVRNAELAVSSIFERNVCFIEGDNAPRPIPDVFTSRRKETIQKAMLLALLHDIGHGPFGHALDIYVSARERSAYPKPDKMFTEDYVRSYLAGTLTALGFEPGNIIKILGPNKIGLEGMDALLADVVDSSLDVDRMDYLVRDAHSTGLMMGFTNTMSLIEFMRPVWDDARGAFALAYDEEAVGYMEHFLIARDAMYFNCYERPRKKAAERIFTKVVDDLVADAKVDIRDLFGLSDEEVCGLIRCSPGGSEARRNLVKELFGDLQYELILSIPAASGENEQFPSKVIANWVERAIEGKTLELTYIDQPRTWEQAIAESSIGRERAWEIQITVPAKEAYRPTELAVKLLTKDGARYRTVDFLKARLSLKPALEHLNLQRQTIEVLCPARLTDLEKDKVRSAAKEILLT